LFLLKHAEFAVQGAKLRAGRATRSMRTEHQRLRMRTECIQRDDWRQWVDGSLWCSQNCSLCRKLEGTLQHRLRTWWKTSGRFRVPSAGQEWQESHTSRGYCSSTCQISAQQIQPWELRCGDQ